MQLRVAFSVQKSRWAGGRREGREWPRRRLIYRSSATSDLSLFWTRCSAHLSSFRGTLSVSDIHDIHRRYRTAGVLEWTRNQLSDTPTSDQGDQGREEGSAYKRQESNPTFIPPTSMILDQSENSHSNNNLQELLISPYPEQSNDLILADELESALNDLAFQPPVNQATSSLPSFQETYANLTYRMDDENYNNFENTQLTYDQQQQMMNHQIMVNHQEMVNPQQNSALVSHSSVVSQQQYLNQLSTQNVLPPHMLPSFSGASVPSCSVSSNGLPGGYELCPAQTMTAAACFQANHMHHIQDQLQPPPCDVHMMASMQQSLPMYDAGSLNQPPTPDPMQYVPMNLYVNLPSNVGMPVNTQNLHSLHEVEGHGPQSLPAPIPHNANNCMRSHKRRNSQAYRSHRSQANKYRGEANHSHQMASTSSSSADCVSEMTQFESNGVAEFTFAAAIASSHGTTPPSQLCAVCGDTAACQHYGVRTCEGCKGFFKRTVQKGSKYVCLADKSCPVDKRRRNRCQYCRFQKCLSVGMVKEVVRTDSLKGRRGRLPSKPKSPHALPSSPPVPLITSLARAHVASSPDMQSPDYTQYAENNGEYNTDDDERHRDLMYHVLTGSLRVIQGFAENVPGFVDLCYDDQMVLLKTASLELFILRFAYRSRIDDNRFVFCNGLVLTKSQCFRSFGEWLDSILGFSDSLHSMNLEVPAFAALCGMVLTTRDRSGLKEPAKVKQMHTNIATALKDYLNFENDQQKHCFIMQLREKVEALRTIAIQGANKLRHMI